MLKLAQTKLQKSEEIKKEISSKERKIYVGIDVHQKQWNITILGEKREIMKGKTVPPDSESLIKLIKNKIDYDELYIAYEAGFSGFWIQRQLEALGAIAIVVNPADIPSTDKDTRQKTDKRDSYKIALTLRAGLLKPIYIPTQEEEEHQGIIRRRSDLVKKRARIKNNIKGYLKKYGIKIQCAPSAPHKWSKNYIKALAEFAKTTPGHKYQMESMLRELQYFEGEITLIDKEILLLMKSAEHAENYKNLKSVPGIAEITASTFLLELYNVQRFDSFTKFASYIGIIPTEHSSGAKQKIGGMTKRSCTKIKSMLIESSWVSIGADATFKEYYKKLLMRMQAQKAIIRCARKLLSRIYHILKYKEEYKPELKAA